MNNNYDLPWYYSWPVIIAAFFFCWPVGIILVIMRNSANKKTMFSGTSQGKIYVIIGVILIIAGLGSLEGSILSGLFFIAGGVALIYYSKQVKKKALRYKQYIELIVNREETSLDRIASTCNIQYDIVVKDLKLMIEKDILDGAILDQVGRTITVSKPAPMRPASYAAPQVEGYAAPVEVSCVCPGCGAKNVVTKGTTINCEYCDSPISA